MVGFGDRAWPQERPVSALHVDPLPLLCPSASLIVSPSFQLSGLGLKLRAED